MRSTKEDRAWAVVEGKALDNYAHIYGMKRKRWLYIFRETDRSLRARLLKKLRGQP